MKKVTQDEVRELAKYMAQASPIDVFRMFQDIDERDDSREIREALAMEFMSMITQELIDSIKQLKEQETCCESEECCEDCDIQEYKGCCEEEQPLSKEIAQQLEQVQLNKSIADLLAASKETAASAQKVEEEVFNLSAYLKQQVEQQTLSSLIQSQLEEQNCCEEDCCEEDDEDCCETDDLTIGMVLDEVVDHIVSELDQDQYNLNDFSIGLTVYSIETRLKREFYDFGWDFDTVYQPDFAAYILTGVISALVEDGYQFAFEVQNDLVIPVFTRE